MAPYHVLYIHAQSAAHIIPKQACVVLHIYISGLYMTFLNLHSGVYSPNGCGLYSLRVLSSTIQAHLLQGTIFMVCLFMKYMVRLSLKKLGQLTTFCHQGTWTLKPQDYQSSSSARICCLASVYQYFIFKLINVRTEMFPYNVAEASWVQHISGQEYTGFNHFKEVWV